MHPERRVESTWCIHSYAQLSGAPHFKKKHKSKEFPVFCLVPCSHTHTHTRAHTHAGYIGSTLSQTSQRTRRNVFCFAAKDVVALWLWHGAQLLLKLHMKNASTNTRLFSLEMRGPLTGYRPHSPLHYTTVCHVQGPLQEKPLSMWWLLLQQALTFFIFLFLWQTEHTEC